MKAFMAATLCAAGLSCATSAVAHPMGNFSVNHYARLEPGANDLSVTYVLDLAELPTTELIQSWGVERDAPRSVMQAQAAAQARQWAANLRVTENGRPVLAILQSTELAVESGAANLPIYRIAAKIRFLAKGGRVEFEDGNYATRAGWREIVVRAAGGAELLQASAGPEERSQALTLYPKDQEKSPPQDSKAWLEWRMSAPPAAPATFTATVAPDPVVPPAPAASPESPPSVAADASHANRAAGLIAGLIAVLFLARRVTRNRYPVG